MINCACPVLGSAVLECLAGEGVHRMTEHSSFNPSGISRVALVLATVPMCILQSQGHRCVPLPGHPAPCWLSVTCNVP